jgi:4-hydroxy-3-methylbut-2-enyl diphosphate reductase
MTAETTTGKRIVIAEPHGFCAGVRRAIDAIERALVRFPRPVYCLNEIVHNRQVVEGLAARGVVFVRDIGAVPRGACVVFSAHGVPPAVRRAAQARGLQVLDATCPFVQKLHTEVREYASRGYDVLLVGYRAHDEVVGIRGEAPDRVRVVENREEAETVRVRDPRKLVVLTQTTLSVDEAAGVIAALRTHFPHLETPQRDGICRATVHRQEAVKRLVEAAGRILVLGSRNSSNTRRLAEVAQAQGAEAFLVDDMDALEAVPLDDTDTIGLTAGASTPEEFMDDVVAALAARGFTRVEHLRGRKEDIRFALPGPVRDTPGRPRRATAPPARPFSKPEDTEQEP